MSLFRENKEKEVDPKGPITVAETVFVIETKEHEGVTMATLGIPRHLRTWRDRYVSISFTTGKVVRTDQKFKVTIEEIIE